MGRGEALRERMALLQQEQERRRRISQLKRDTLKKIEYFQRKTVIETHDVYSLVKWFFREFLEKRYEFTVPELREEIRNVYISTSTRDILNDILGMLESVEYTNVHYTREQLKNLLDAFAIIVQQLVRTHSKKKTLWQRFKSFIFKEEIEPEVIIAELPAIEQDDAENVRVRLLVEKCYASLDRHSLHRAKATYQALLKEYQSLPEKEKKRFYPLLDQTYKDLQNRAEMLG